jgi:hypothetical protein
MRFDEKTLHELKHYVYALIDPRNNLPFYVGKGIDNRVFDHLASALDTPTASDKYDKIREIVDVGLCVNHVIIKHGLTKNEAFKIESALIDYSNYFDHGLTNIMLGHNSIENGLMSSEEVIRKYNAPVLQNIAADCVLININKTYKRGSGFKGIYEATRESWVMDKYRIPSIKYALAEYKGWIVEVFQISKWYAVDTIDNKGKPKVRWGFTGVVAPTDVKTKYFNTSVAHVKVPGASNPIRYTLKVLRKSSPKVVAIK